MDEKEFKQNIKQSFTNAKNDISQLNQELETLKSVILHQNEVIKHLSERVISLFGQAQNPQIDPFFLRSSGNKGVNQSINQSINQTLSTKLPIPQEKEGVQAQNLPIDTSDIPEKIIIPKIEQTTPEMLGEEFQALKYKVDRVFLRLSKQELKVFLTTYQLDEEGDGQGVVYTQIADRLHLTEQCIRGYISGLFKKGLPLEKKKINNKRTVIFINKNFKTLNLKQKLIQLYYGDPQQTTLFDIPK
ncbi:hypothetical protein HZB00_04060 [Candidatus Woesearchaeota archaeon]|nr:hypothetical protein [Candidatus Woesearchaeota archaeon]